METEMWDSQLARQLLTETGAASIHDALIFTLDRKLTRIGFPKYPIDLPLIASVFGIDHNFNYVEMEQAGRLVYLDEKWVIEINKNHSHTRQRFSIAHEIGHKAILTSKQKAIKERTAHNSHLENDEEEKICDLFATLLLGLRPEYISSILADRGFSLETADFLTKRLDISFETGVRGLTQYAETPAAILYCLPATNEDSEKFIIQRYYSTKQFKIPLRSKSTMPALDCLSRAWFGTSIAKTIEPWQTEYASNYLCTLEAKRMPIYMSGSKMEGLVVTVITQ